MGSETGIEALQPEAWRALAALRRRLPHALLLAGPAGVGKRALAERFAQWLLCEGKPATQSPCGVCAGCRWAGAGSHPDLRIVQPEAAAREGDEGANESEARPRGAKLSHDIRIDEVRAIAGFVNLVSHRGGLRIALIDPAQNMNAPAASALLKSLEEPPAGAVFLLVSDRPARLLPTVRSRCVRIPVGVPDAQAAVRWLEQCGVREAGRWLAFAGGAPARVLELAEQGSFARIETLVAALQAEARPETWPLEGRPEMELFVEVLQKFSADQAAMGFGLPPLYFPGLRRSDGVSGLAWVNSARALGKTRWLASHPINPRLYAAEAFSCLTRG